MYREHGQYVQAETLYLRALSIREQALEPYHLDTAETLHGLAMLREVQGNQIEAATFYQRALSIRERVLGSQHSRTTQTRERLRLVLVTQGETQEAAQLEGAPAKQTEMKREL
jgi:hypothetical protein